MNMTLQKRKSGHRNDGVEINLVRIWNLPVSVLDNKHLVAEHGELHCLYNVITKNLKGFANHPQTNRFRKHLDMLIDRHNHQVGEMLCRGFKHNSPLKQVGKYEFYEYEYDDYLFDLFTLDMRNGVKDVEEK